jgi:peptide deformylase
MAEIRSAPWFNQTDPVSRPVVKTSPHPLFGKAR